MWESNMYACFSWVVYGKGCINGHVNCYYLYLFLNK